MPARKNEIAPKNGAKKTDSHPDPAGKVASNLYLNGAVKSRGLDTVRKLGYELSEAVELFLEKLHEARVNKPNFKRGDPLQITFFDRLKSEAETERAKKKK